jgi:demethylmenaquinone methyltransferase/2-methoxy-6-polyprenyl-1,4-benzoquinol methylase
MFGRIALRYDLMNRLMTFGQDTMWRRFTVAQVLSPPRKPASCEEENRRDWLLDVATGTGDLAFEALRQQPGLRVMALDFTPEMLTMARSKTTNPATSPGWLAGDALRLPFPHGRFDAVVTAFALRNVTDIAVAFVEMARVTRPGGKVACLEISRPRLPLFRSLFAFYFYRMVPLLGRWMSGERSAYTYLPHSLTAFLTPDQIAEVMRQSGWGQVRYRRLMLGTVAVHMGVRE